MPITEDLSAFLADFGVAAVFGAYSAQVIFDAADTEVLAGRVQTTDYLIRYVTDSLPGLGYGAAITVDGQSFVVQQVLAIDDGKFSTAILQA